MSSTDRLPTEKVRPYIDLVNLLWSAEQDVALPAIAVIGDQNSGKSSVLEALSGVTLPRGRYYTLTLQMNNMKGGEWNGSVKSDQCSTEKRIGPQNRKDVHDLMRYFYGISSVNLEISSPDVPDLTLIDLPTIPRMKDDEDFRVKTKIREVIKNPEVIILMVVPCNVNIETTEAFKLAQEVDPDGERTMGLLTKPDIVDEVKEKTIVDIVQNKVVNLKKGYMIVRCYDQTQMTLMDPKEKENKFFKEHAIFKSLYDGGFATFPKLSERLTQELAQNIEKYLPQLKEYVKKELLQVNEVIKRFGKYPPSDEAEKMTFLNEKLNSFFQDALKLTRGELLDFTDQRAFSAWRKFVKDSEESFQVKLEADVTLHENTAFSDFQTFDHVIKDHIRLLEEPAVFTLKKSAEIVNKELLKLMDIAFYGFPKLISKAESIIRDLTSGNQKAAESLLRTQFKMELFEVHAQARRYTNKKREKKKGTPGQLYSYYQTVCQRLTCQVQMIIHFHIINESSSQMQKKMLQMLDDKNVSKLLEYDMKMKTLRDKIQKSFIPLTNAQMLLLEL